MTNEHAWKRMMFKGHKVWLFVDSGQQPIVKNGKVLIKYQLDQDYEYWVSEQAVKPIDPQHLKAKVPTKDPRSHTPLPGAQNRKESAPPGTILVYTDGASSGNPGPAGIGVLLRYGSLEKEISEHIGITTNNVAELLAIKKALEAIRTPDMPVRLHTDSQYCYGLLALGWKARQNKGLVADLKRLMGRFADLKILKIEGHVGIGDNERADKLARAGAKKASGKKALPGVRKKGAKEQ
jgi:ribonuclease HI